MFNSIATVDGNSALILIGMLVLWVLVSSITLECRAPDDILSCIALNTAVVVTHTAMLQPVGALITLILISVYRFAMYHFSYTPKDCIDIQVGYASGEWATLVTVCLIRHLT